MSEFKTYGAIAIMIGCFVVIYPRFMHPIVQSAFGYKDQPQKVDNSHGGMPPGYKGHPSGSPRGSAEEMRKNMRQGPHPGMRAAAEMHRQQGQQGSSRGMMGVVLPMYAVGIILYLAYTLYKVFNKNNAKNEAAMSLGSSRYARERGGHHFQGERDRMGFPRDFDGSDDIHNFLHDEEHRHNLEDLLTRVDDKNVSVEEMRILQKRLEETEAQMTRILSAMQSVNANVDRRNTTETESGQADAGDEGRDPDSQEAEEVEEIICDQDPSSTKATDGGADGHDANEETEQGNAEEEEGGDQLAEAEEEDEQAVDEMIEAKKTDNGDDETKESSVRQRNIKTNEQ